MAKTKSYSSKLINFSLIKSFFDLKLIVDYREFIEAITIISNLKGSVTHVRAFQISVHLELCLLVKKKKKKQRLPDSNVVLFQEIQPFQSLSS